MDVSVALDSATFQEDLSEQNDAAYKAFENAFCLVINPKSTFWRCWEYLTNLSVFYLMMFTPWYISFCNPGQYPPWDRVEDIVGYLYIVDTAFQFFVAYFDETKEKWVTDLNITYSPKLKDSLDLKFISLNYLKFWFWPDLLSVIPFENLFEGDLNVLFQAKVVEMVVLVRLSKLPKLYRLVKVTKIVRAMRKARGHSTLWANLHDFLRVNEGLFRLIINLVSVMLFCHWMACLWHLLPQLQESNDSWTTRSSLQDSSDLTRYFASLYWVVQTVITVGYGDFPCNSPKIIDFVFSICKSVAERLVAIVTMFTGVIFVSLTVGTIMNNTDYYSIF